MLFVTISIKSQSDGGWQKFI